MEMYYQKQLLEQQILYDLLTVYMDHMLNQKMANSFGVPPQVKLSTCYFGMRLLNCYSQLNFLGGRNSLFYLPLQTGSFHREI